MNIKVTRLSTIKRISLLAILVPTLFDTRGSLFSDGINNQSQHRTDLAPAFSSASRRAQHLPNLPKLEKEFGQLSVYFEVNQGQVDPRVKFIVRNGGGGTTFLTETEATFALPSVGFGLRNEDRLSIGDFRLWIGRTTNDSSGITNNLGPRISDLRQVLNPQSQIDNL